MFDLDRKIGIKSFSFRHVAENREVAAIARRCGVNAVDLSGCHVNYDTPESWPAVIAAYRDAGVAITGIGVVMAEPDEARNRRFFEFAKAAGAGVVSVSFKPEKFQETLSSLTRLSEEYGIAVAIHNHGGYDWLGNQTILQFIFDQTSERIGLCLDTAWAIQARENPVKWLEIFGSRLYAIHFKDFLFEPKGKTYDTVVGEGALDLPEVLKMFRQLDFQGSAVVEYEGASPEEATAASVRNLRNLWQNVN